ncbi:DHH family phosphoesterase [Sandaracinus amylolyticus]|uniref:3'-to-5' oligoribonuclease A n=1 Tax=Sandaracinus amylolyticus TaxID=927083 RepID=A0A0F6W331_9BACT|nr:DHH family phosphoesterase [Sandaracinus amylolyticus]AKF06243.1 3'-to-5' oligoribonuclease A [Sandaracinus amylolyticus]
MSRARAVELVRAGSRFLVTCHVRPDADALGSALGLAAILRSIGKDALVYSQDGVPPLLQFLDGKEKVARDVPPGRFDATFVMDAAARELVPPLPPSERSGPVVIVDHHAAADGFGDVIVREVDAVATGEVVLRLMQSLGVKDVPRDAAQPVYAAIVADTGGFRYSGTNATTHRLAAQLLEQGVDPWQVASHLFERWAPQRMALLGEVLRAMKIELDGRLAIVAVDREMMARTGASDDMIEGMVNYGRMLEGVEIAALLWTPEKGQDVKISLRSAGRADVAALAVTLGGGGHRAAAGASVRNAELATVVARLRDEAAKVLARH